MPNFYKMRDFWYFDKISKLSKIPWKTNKLVKSIKTNKNELFDSFLDIFWSVQVLMPNNFDLKKTIFTTHRKNRKMQNLRFCANFFHLRDASLFVSHAPSSGPFPQEWSKIEVVTNKNILNVIMTQFGMIGLIVVAIAHCFEIFYKITKNNILPTNFKNFKKFQISKIKFSDILPKLFPYLLRCSCLLIWLLLQVFWYCLSKKLTIMGVK